MVIESTLARAGGAHALTLAVGVAILAACSAPTVRQVGPAVVEKRAQGGDRSSQTDGAGSAQLAPDSGALDGDPAVGPARCERAPATPASCASAAVREVPVLRQVTSRPSAGTFEVGKHSALIWAHSPVSTRARIDVQRAHSNRPGVKKRYSLIGKYYMNLPAKAGNTGVYQLGKLQPDQVYRYRVQFSDGDGTDWYYLRTAPEDDADAPVHFVFGAEFSNDPRFASPLLDSMARSGASFFISLGDWPYTDLPVQDRTVDQYRASHRLARSLPQTQKLLQALPLYAIYDDHDIKNDWDISLIQESPRRARAALQVWDEFFPVRDRSSSVMDRVRYRTWRWGQHAQFFLLDTRRYRSFFRDEDNSKKAMLGPEQMAWLHRELAASTATFKLILTTVPFDFGTTREHWRAYRFARKKIYDFLRQKGISGVVFLTGDQHWLSIHDLETGHREYQVGPLQSFLRTPPEERSERVLFELAVANYGEVMITRGPRPRLVFTARGKGGELLYVDTLEPMVTPPSADDGVGQRARQPPSSRSSNSRASKRKPGGKASR